MDKINIFNNIMKIFLINLYISIIFFRIINFKIDNNYKKIIIIIFSFLLAIIYTVLITNINQIIFSPLLYFLYSVLLTYISKNKLGNSIIIVMISFAISYIIYLLSVVIAGIMLFYCNINYDNPLCMLAITIVSTIFMYIILKIKRFKKGIYFLKDSSKVENIGIVSILVFGIVLVIRSVANLYINWIVNSYLFIGVILIAISIAIWLQKQTTKTYRTKMRDRTIEIQKAEIDEKSKMIEEIKTENLKLATAIHKYNHKFESLELAMKNALKIESKTEFAEELSIILKEVKETSKNFAEATNVNMVKLPETNIPGIDNMFKYMQEEARKNNINFDLKINASINPLIDKIIPKEKFEILIGDHLKDAIIAVNSSEKSYKSILVILGLVDGIYEFSVYDTGIEFEIDTLLKLGKEQVTTHKETGGSGIGFMTTFETLKQCKGSLIIEEYNPETTSYTKSVTIRFDGKNKYKICSYRAEKIKEQKTKRRIIIQKLK